MDGSVNKIKLDTKTILILAVGGMVVLIGAIMFTSSTSTSDSQSGVKEVVTKTQSKTYSKYVALNESSGIEASTSPTLGPTVSPVASASPTVEPTSGLSPTAEPTEIILAGPSPTATASSVTQNEPTKVTSLPTTGTVEGSIFVFVVSLSLIAFAFVF